MTNISMEQRERVANSKWFHAIDFGSFASQGRFPPGKPQNITLYPAMDILSMIDFSNKSFIDIGCADGLISFGVKKLGAEKVVAIDSFDQHTFRLARDLTGEDVEYVPGCQIKDAPEHFGYGQFDVALCAGVIYHMLNPTTAFINARKILKQGGILLMESPIAAGDDAVMHLNSEGAHTMNEILTYWVPTATAMIGMMKLVGFDVIGVRFLSAPRRCTVIGRAAPVDQIANRSEILTKMHQRDFCDFELLHSKLSTAQTSVPLVLEEFEKTIDPMVYKPSFPYHPSHEADHLGTTKWMHERGNY